MHMGWQSRLPKDQKPEFKKTCNKCGDTGIKKTFVSIAGVSQTALVQCKCQSAPEPKEVVVTLPVK
jgi:hypothetical protein